MSSEKAHAQSGHAYTDAILNALSLNDPAARAYATLRPGTKICLDGGSEVDLLRLLDRLVATPLPHVSIIDSGHVEPPDFDGSPVLTAIGIGPLFRAEAPPFLKRLPLWTRGSLPVLRLDRVMSGPVPPRPSAATTGGPCSPHPRFPTRPRKGRYE